MTRATLQVLACGPLTLVQDHGRTGYAAFGVGRSGAADRAAYRLGQRLVANPDGAAGLEITLGGFAARAVGGALTVVVTGAPAPARLDDRPVGHAAVLTIADGATLRLDRPLAGLRSYLAVRGGLTVPAVLGSRSTDTLSGIGPPPVTPGQRLPVGDVLEIGPGPLVDLAPVPPSVSGQLDIGVLPGPRSDWLADHASLTRSLWRIGPDSDRVGVRLIGPVAPWSQARVGTELPSEAVLPGAVQLPPSGQPVVLMADAPTTGGYPVVAVVREADLDRLAQGRPGQPVRLQWWHRPVARCRLPDRAG